MPSSDRKKRQAASMTTHVVIFVVCAVLIMFSKADIAGGNSLRGIVADFFVPIADAVTIPFRAVAAMWEGVESVAFLREENQRLTSETAELRHWQQQAEILAAENRELRALTQVAIPPGMTHRAARVIAINADSFAHVVMLNVGSQHGIIKNSAVVTEDGLVGVVIRAGLFYSQVLLITDLNAMVPVILTSASWPGVTSGVNGDYVELRFLPSQASPRLGELVQTSGHGGVLPPNLPVGRITSISDGSIRIDPSADLRRLTYVTVLVWDNPNARLSDALDNQAYSPLPPADDTFSLEGINALGRRAGDNSSSGDQNNRARGNP